MNINNDLLLSVREQLASIWEQIKDRPDCPNYLKLATRVFINSNFKGLIKVGKQMGSVPPSMLSDAAPVPSKGKRIYELPSKKKQNSSVVVVDEPRRVLRPLVVHNPDGTPVGILEGSTVVPFHPGINQTNEDARDAAFKGLNDHIEQLNQDDMTRLEPSPVLMYTGEMSEPEVHEFKEFEAAEGEPKVIIEIENEIENAPDNYGNDIQDKESDKAGKVPDKKIIESLRKQITALGGSFHHMAGIATLNKILTKLKAESVLN